MSSLPIAKVLTTNPVSSRYLLNHAAEHKASIDELSTLLFAHSVHGNELALIENALERDIASANDEHALFRETTVSSRLVGKYFNLFGRSLVSNLFSANIVKRISKHTWQISNPEHLKELERTTLRLFNGIVDSIDEISPNIRLVLQTAGQIASRRFGTSASHFAETAGLSFLILRLIVHAISFPGQHHLLQKPLNAAATANCVHLARLLQAIFTGKTFIEIDPFSRAQGFVDSLAGTASNFLHILASEEGLVPQPVSTVVSHIYDFALGSAEDLVEQILDWPQPEFDDFAATVIPAMGHNEVEPLTNLETLRSTQSFKRATHPVQLQQLAGQLHSVRHRKGGLGRKPSVEDIYDDPVALQLYIQRTYRSHSFTVLIFYRGDWCLFCSNYMKKWNKALNTVKKMGGTLVGVTAQSQKIVTNTRLKAWQIQYPLYGDPSNTIANQFGLDITEAPSRAGDYGNGVAQPGLVVLDSSGSVVFSWVQREVSERTLWGARDRPLPRDVLVEVRNLLEVTSTANPSELSSFSESTSHRSSSHRSSSHRSSSHHHPHRHRTHKRSSAQS